MKNLLKQLGFKEPLIEELQKRELPARYIFELSEADNWVNDATRKALNFIADTLGDRVFGLQFWKWRFFKSDELRNAPNFSIDLIFLEEDRPQVEQLIQQYENRQIDNHQIVYKLFDLAIYNCTWV